MTFQLQVASGSSTPASQDSHPAPGDEGSLVSALHTAFRSFGSHSPSPSLSRDAESNSGPKPQASLEIITSSQTVFLKGTGSDVEPGVMSGHVSLYLTEATSIKEITLQFRGKTWVPADPSDPHVLNNAHNAYIVCRHDWSFLEGKRGHSHTLKPGRHVFPFELSLGGSLPSSIATHANGGASVSYKLRATVTRPGFATKLTATCPIVITRTLASEALEYHQTLEVETTWPEKVMYSIMIPYKAWAAGDDLTAVIKLVPLTKGIQLIDVTTHINETTKTHCRRGHLEDTKCILTKKHVIIDGHAVCIEEPHSHQLPQSHGQGRHSRHGSVDSTYLTSIPGSSSAAGPSTIFPSASARSSPEPPSTSHDAESTSANPPDSEPTSEPEDHDVTAHIVIPLPTEMVPSHYLDPIRVSYRIRLVAIVSTRDGHTCELRCSLPIYILHHTLLEEARSATRLMRQVLLGDEEVAAAAADEAELPSYPAHVRDPVADIFHSESPMVRVTDPWGINHVDPPPGQLATPGARTPSSGSASPAVPATPDMRPGTPATPELLPSSSVASLPREPRASSRQPSRQPSRAGSPERATQVHVHARAYPPHGLFSMALKPLASITHPWTHVSGGPTVPASALRPSQTPPGISVDVESPPRSVSADSFTEVPTYEVAARGFLGGGAPPLDSLRGLPSYEEARSASGSDLASDFSPARQLELVSTSAAQAGLYE